MARRPKRPGDFAQRAKLIVDLATGELPREPIPQPDSPAMEARRKGGRKGGKARARKLSTRKRREIAKEAARVRWRKARP